jgi:hypothetical protein
MSVAWNCEVRTCTRPAPHICAVNGPCNGWPRETVKPFKPLPSKIVTLTIEEDGSQTFLKTDSADIFLECGEVITRRASHVEPANWALRFVFSLLRTLSADTSIVAAWTRTWPCLWRVNTKPVGGPILNYWNVPSALWVSGMYVGKHNAVLFANRQVAIDAEIVFLNDFFAERKI